MHAVIFANGELEKPKDWHTRLAGADLIIAADGGAQHCHALGLLPKVLIGDLDSLSPTLRTESEKQNVRIIAYPTQKDQTDFELALLYAKETGAEKVTVLGGLGRRWDHSLANLLLAAEPRFVDMRIIYLHGEQRLTILKGEQTIDAIQGERVSLLPLIADTQGVSTRGLEYPLINESLAFGSSRGVSNKALLDFPGVAIREGVLLCVVSSFDLV